MNTRVIDLPEPVTATLSAAGMCELATVARDGLPIDTQMICAVDPEASFVPLSTGLAYPAKAYRARRNPRVGLLFEAPRGGAVVSIAAIAAVRDADISANALRYAASFPAMIDAISGGRPWDEVRRAHWYWARIFIECTPVSIDWWPAATAMDQPPQRWVPSEPITVPVSDPAPPGRPAPGSGWEPIADWRARAREVTTTTAPHLTVVDDEGYPRPVRLASATPNAAGFDMDWPAGVPWLPADGRATLSFDGRATFVGHASARTFRVDRMLPDLPLVTNPAYIFDPPPEVRGPLVARIDSELERRGQRAPLLPADRDQLVVTGDSRMD